MIKMFSYRSSLFLLILVSANGVQGFWSLAKEKSCDLECPRNAPCRFGQADFSGRTGMQDSENETHQDGMHCDCPIGWTGILCDQKYETCTFQEGHECYNGGECILGLEDKYGNEQLFCDCSKADGHVGKYCETPIAKTCGDDDGLFCANGGVCNPDFPELSSQACFCDEGWEGYHCEYKKDQVPDCSLDCQNDGICFIGADKDGTIRWSDSSEEHMFCSCPPGFGGPLCEAPAEYCGNGHLCLNGGTCVTTSVESSDGMVHSRHHCDCTTSNKFVAGKYCENEATSICGESDWDSFFCTQGGACKSNPLEGCSCLDGTAGFKCEFTLDSSDQYNGNSNKIQDVEKPQNSDILYDDDDDYFDNINNKRRNTCGDGYCLNGGICVTEQITMQDGISDMKEYCDCSQAYDASSKYAGLFCQYKSTSLCQVENSLKNSLDSTFCVHNGICQEDGSCGCLDGWTGQHCELKSLGLGGNSASQVIPDSGSGDTYIEVDECGDTTCYNGGICVKSKRQQSNGDFLVETHCDCSTAFDEKYLYAGLSCEFPSTQICSVPPGGQDLSGSSFCTNHGICEDNSELGCDCAPGFYGSACEYEGEVFDQMEEDDDDDDWEVCGPGMCHHGGTCITSIIYSEETDTSETRYSCDCSTAYDDERAYLGTSCEYPSTAVCAPPKSGESLSSARFCVNHGTCNQDSLNDCDCRDGFEGRFCQFKIGLGQIDDDKDDDDDDGYDQEFELCGDNLICFNGGKCVTTIDSNEDGETFEVRTCDCDSASNGVDFFAGSSCEYMATSLCPASTKASFCVNGGQCQENGVCGCELPWKGNHCEFPVDAKDPSGYHSESSSNRADDYDQLTECNLKCMNGGVCVQGAKDLGAFRDSIKDIAHLNQTYAEDQFAHCACTSGWIGLTCENKVEVCGDNQHLCFHGSKCISDNNADRGYSCDCSQANDTVGSNGEVRIFAGDACQYADVEICTIGEEHLGQPQYFCVNGGSCNAKVPGDVPDPGCRCLDNYEGPHCEVHRTISKKRGTSSQADRVVLIAALMLPIIGMLVLVASYTRSLLLTGRKNEAVITDNDVPVTRTPFSPRRRRRSGFGKEPPSNQNSAVSDIGGDGDVDAIASVGRVAENEGVMSGFCLEGESPPYADKQENFVQNSSEDDLTELQGSHFVWKPEQIQ